MNSNWRRLRTWRVAQANGRGKPRWHSTIPLCRQARLRQVRIHLQGFIPLENSYTLQVVVTPFVKSLLSWALSSLGFSPSLPWQNLTFRLLSCTSKEFARRQKPSVLQSIAGQEDWLISKEIAGPSEVLYLVLLLSASALSYLGLTFSPQIPGYIAAPCRLS
jgi:hypothetical protein